MDASLAATAATAGYTPALWLASLLALAAAVVAYVVMGGASGHRTAHVRRPTRGHVRRAAARFLFHAADASSVDVSAGEVTLADGVARAARAVAVVERGAHLSDGRALRVRIGEEAAAGGVERVLNFPSRRAAEAFQDALLHAQRRAAAPRPRAVTLSLNTWNVGNAEPPQDLAPWMDATRHADVIAFGTQECSYSVSAGTGPSRATSAGAAAADKALDGGGLSAPTLVEASVASTMDMSSTDLLVGDPTLSSANNLSGKEHWHAVVKAHFPKSEYVSVAEIASWDRCLSVFVKRELAEAVSHVRSDTAFVGLGGVAGNKGAVAVRFSIFDTDFVIVNSHLAAHQGHAARRNQDYSSIASSLRGLRDGPSVDVLTSTVHHVFWMGDLNYRIDLDRGDVLAKVEGQDYGALFEADQLRRAMEAGEAFVGFDEAPITFPPTYRYERGNRRYSSTKMRIPSYCDRILKRSLPGLAATVETYTSVDAVMTSDHSPVRATIRADLMHASGLCRLDEIGEVAREPAPPAAGDAAAAPAASPSSPSSSSPRDVAVGAAGAAAAGSKVADDDVAFELTFTRLAASALPMMDGPAQVSANRLTQTVSGADRAPARAGSYGATGTTSPAMTTAAAAAAAAAAAPNSPGYCDPYCVFHGDAVAELECGNYSTEVIKATQTPAWAGGATVPLADELASRARTRYLTVTVMDEDVGSADDIVGSAVLWLGEGWGKGGDGAVACAEFTVDLLYGGRTRGALSGAYVVRRVRGGAQRGGTPTAAGTDGR